jgi:YegS/Rv2252/BmrU family lipid kinase
MGQIKTAAMVINAKSRKGQALFEQARDIVRDFPFPVECHAVEDPRKLDDTVLAALAKKPDILILGGGDGTISGLVDHLVHSNCALGVLPLGTANSFARTLGLPLDLPGALEVIRQGQLKRIDLGMIDKDYYANCAAIGISPQIAESVPHNLKKYLGRAGYLSWAVWQYVKFRPFTLIVDDGSDVTRMRVVEVRISNGRFHGGTELVEDAELDSGEIIVQAVRGGVKRNLLWSWFASATKLEARHATLMHFTGKTLKVDTIPRLPISIDGEVLAHTPVTARVAAGVIEVAVPADVPTG